MYVERQANFTRTSRVCMGSAGMAAFRSHLLHELIYAVSATQVTKQEKKKILRHPVAQTAYKCRKLIIRIMLLMISSIYMC